MPDIINYIKDKIIEVEPNADIRDGSALYDLMISPLYSILNPFSIEHEKLINFLSLKNPETMSSEEMDYIASNFFIERQPGSKVTGNVRIYFDRPVNINIPKNTRFSTKSGKNFFNILGYSISRTDMLAKVEGSLYYAGDILVEAELAGKEYEIASNEIDTVDSISVFPTRIRNPLTFTGGTARESNIELADRISATFINSALMSPDGIEKTLKNLYSDIKTIQVVGAGSSYMKRDIISTDVSKLINFLGKVYAITSYPNNRNIAYIKAHAAYDPITSGIRLPDPTMDFNKEFIQGEYFNIYKKADGFYATHIEQKELETETFNGQNYLISGLGANQYVNEGWILSDGILGLNKNSPLEFALKPELHSISLGVHSDDIPANTNLSLPLIAELSVILQRVVDGHLDLRDITWAANLITQLQNAQNPEIIFNYAPIFHRHIDLNNNIEITGKFNTTDDTVDGVMSYITVNRNIGVIAPHDGFGIAWKKGDGTTYNVYIVDNNVLQDDIWTGKSMITHDYGINNFVQAYKLTINTNTWYKFKIQITNKYGVNAWINTTGDFSGNPDIQLGETFGVDEKPLAAEQGSHFGVSVGGTRNNEWLYGDLKITILGDNYPLHMFQMYMDPSIFIDGDSATINYYGYGEGIDSAGVVQQYSTKLYLYNQTDSDWEEIGEHTNNASQDIQIYTSSGLTPNFVVSSKYRSATPGYLTYIMASADTTEEPNHRLNTDYVEVTRGEGTHCGNHVDIYIDAPIKISTGSVDKAVNNGSVTLNSGGSPDTLGPVQDIISVAIGSTALNSKEWRFEYISEGEAFSDNALIRIIPQEPYNIDSTVLTITYRYLLNGESMQNTVTSDNFRSPSSNNKIKVMPPYTVVINDFPYTGNISSSDMKAAIKSYINNLISKTISKTDLVSIALNNGATNIELNDIDAEIRYQTIEGKQKSVVLNNQYTIESVGAFYTDTNELSGVTQI